MAKILRIERPNGQTETWKPKADFTTVTLSQAVADKLRSLRLNETEGYDAVLRRVLEIPKRNRGSEFPLYVLEVGESLVLPWPYHYPNLMRAIEREKRESGKVFVWEEFPDSSGRVTRTL